MPAQTRSMTSAKKQALFQPRAYTKVEVKPQPFRRQTRAYAKTLESLGIKSDITKLELYHSACAEFNKCHKKYH